MNILVLTEMWPPRGGQFVLDQVKELNCHRLLLRPYLSDDERKFKSGFIFTKLGNLFTCFFEPPKHNKYFSWIILALRCVRSIKKNFVNFDIIHAHFGFNCAPAAALIAWIFKKKLVITLHGTDVNYYLNTPAKYSMRWAFKRADAIICVAEHLKRKILADVPLSQKDEKFSKLMSKTFVINNGFDPKLFYRYTKAERDACREMFKVDDYDKVFCFVGNLEPVKNVSTLITAFADFLTSTSSVTKKSSSTSSVLLIIGDGSERNRLQNTVVSLNLSGHVRFLGQVPHNDIPKYMNAADFLVLPSLSEGNPCVVIEALACGLPVIMSDILASRELIGLGGLFSKFDSELIRDAAKAKFDSKQISKNAQMYSYDKQAQKILNVYKKVMES